MKRLRVIGFITLVLLAGAFFVPAHADTVLVTPTPAPAPVAAAPTQTSAPLVSPSTTSSSSTNFFGPIIPAACNCDGQVNGNGTSAPTSAADWGCVFQTIQNLMKLAVSLGVLIVTLFILYAGFLLVFSSVNQASRSRAKQVFMNAVIGLVIVLGAWLIIDTLMKVIYNTSAQGSGVALGPWNSIISSSGSNPCILPQAPPKSFATSLTAVNNTIGGNGSPTAPGTGTSTGATGGNTGLNVSAAIQWLTSHAKQPPYTKGTPNQLGQCASYVRQGICAGGLQSFCAGGPDASSYGPVLTSRGFVEVYSGTYSHGSSESAFPYQPGDVVVFQPVSGHPVGHIAMFSGSSWISDYIQPNGMSSNYSDYQGGSFAVYRP